MEFFESLTLDLKLLVIAIAGCALLALFSGNRNTEKRYMVALAVFAAVGLWRFMHVPHESPAEQRIAEERAPHFTKVETKHVPLVSTSAK